MLNNTETKSTKVPWLLSQTGSGGPNFICIGAQKGGTRWLFDQLNHHPDFWMPPIKEICYLDDGMRFKRRARRLRRKATKDLAETNRELALRHDRPLEPIDVKWLKARLWMAGRSTNYDWYACLFNPRGSRLSGDISPPYAVISDARAKAARQNLQGTKFLYLARDPVERLWSQYCMVMRRHKQEIQPDPQIVRNYLETKQAIRHSSIRDVVRRWQLGPDDPDFRVFFFDDLRRDPQGLLASILDYLGASQAANTAPFDADYNRKKDRSKIVMTEEIRDYLVEVFADEIRGCADLLGGPAADWPAKYGL